MVRLSHELRGALRLFVRDWRFSLTVVVTLASGIAATAIVFNVVNNTLLRPLPIPDEQRVMRLQDFTMGPDGRPLRRSNRAANFLAIQQHVKSFDAVVGLRSADLPLTGGSEPVQATIAMVSDGTFELLGTRAIAGRTFTDAEHRAGTDAAVVLLSHALWQQQFGGRADAVGSTLRLDDRPYTIVGVLGRGFHFPYRAQAWIPERVSESADVSLAVLARLAPGTSPDQAAHELDALGVRLEHERPATNRGLRFAMTPLREQLIGDQADVTWTLLATAALLLALACANVANLLLVRGSLREKEIAVHTALGASHGRQVRQLIVESLVYATAGTLAGLVTARALGGLLMDLVPRALRTELGLAEIAFDWRVAALAATLTTLTALVAGLAPARRLVRVNAMDTLRQQSRGSTGPRSLMQALVVGEMALAAVLLLAAGLMADNITRLTHADLGLEPDARSSVPLALPTSRYASAEQRNAMVRRLLEATRAIPGVQSAAVISLNPLDRARVGAALESEDRLLGPREAGLIVNHRLVSDGWFETAGLRMVRGRPFDERDDERAARVAIISERLSARLWPGADALGKRVRQTQANAPWITVVGVVADVRDTGEWKETWYVPYAQHSATFAGATVHVMVRSPLDADALGRGVREVVRTIDPNLPVPALTRMTATWDGAVEQQHLAASASALFAISGLLLAVIGTYGVLAYAVAARTREFGIRLALGATRRRLLLEVIRQGATLASIGLAIGVAAGLAGNRALQSVATESTGTPAGVVALVLTVLGVSAVAASLLPALRATRVDPADVMRSE